MLSKNTGEGVHLIKKLPAVSLQASKFTKNELLDTSFSRILARFLFIVLFLGIISWKGVSCFSREGFFQMRGCPMGWHQFWWGGVSKKFVRWGACPHAPHGPPTMGNPAPPPPY